MSKKNLLYIPLSAAAAALGTLVLADLANWPQDSGYLLCWPIALGLAGIGNIQFFKEGDRRAKWCFGVLGVLFVITLGLGWRLEAVDETGWASFVLCAFLGLCWGPAAGWYGLVLARWLERQKEGRQGTKQTFWFVWGVLILCWLPVVIAYFPGITGYDMDAQEWQIISGYYNAHHPILHTLFIGLFYNLLGPTIGYGVHTVLQVLMLSAAIAYAMAWLRKIRTPDGLWIALMFFFALSPQHAIMAVSGTKDILFAAAMLVVCVEVCRMLTEPDRSKNTAVILADVAVIALTGMLRNNAVYGMALMWIVALVFFRRNLGKRFLAVLLAGIVAGSWGTDAINKAVNAGGTSIREMMSIPCQQLARVYYKYGTSLPVGYEIPELLPDAENYKPDRSDYTKRSAKVIPNDRLIRFAKLWGREALNHPIEYIDAFLLNTKGFWYLADHTFATTYDEIEGSPIGCMVLKHIDSLQVEAPWMMPKLREVYYHLFTLNGYRTFVPGWMLLHPALYTWLLGFMIAWFIWRRRGAPLMACAILLGYLLTLLLGPCAIIRYQYDLMLAGPVILVFQSGRRYQQEAWK